MNFRELEPRQEQRRTRIERVRPSIAQAILNDDHQIKSKNIFINDKDRNGQNKDQDDNQSKSIRPNRTKSKIFGQFPFSIPKLLGSALAIGANLKSSTTPPAMENHDHHHSHNHDSSMEAEAMRRCSMNMIFNTKPIGTCIVFRQFYVSGTTALIGYLVLLFLMAIGYEYLRLATHRFDQVTAMKLSLRSTSLNNKRSSNSPASSSSRLLPSQNNPNETLTDYNPKLKSGWGKVCVPKDIQITRSLFYVTNVAISFFLMLVVMTYNAQIIAAVLAGAFVGHFLFHRELSFEDNDKGMACH